MSRLGLNRIAHSVARQNLTTGALSGLRQSYKNQATALDFPGLHNPVSRPEGNRPSLTDMWHMPVDYWENMYVRGADIKDGMASELVSNLENAFTMENNPNALAGHDIRWLDLDAAEGGKTKRGSTAKPSLKRPALNVMATAPSGASLRVSTPGSSRSADTAAMLGDLNRPKRSGKKRRYNDDSFEGYGEGFIDDDGVSVSSLGADERRKKRRKVSSTVLHYYHSIHRLTIPSLDRGFFTQPGSRASRQSSPTWDGTHR